jgi:hypothetical protein
MTSVADADYHAHATEFPAQGGVLKAAQVGRHLRPELQTVLLTARHSQLLNQAPPERVLVLSFMLLPRIAHL